MPPEIQSTIKGGDCGKGLIGSDRYIAYSNLEDVYGVTNDLKVYYCDGNGNFIGLDSLNELEFDDLDRIVLTASSPLVKLIKSDNTDATVKDLQKQKSLVIDSTSGVENLKDLYAFVSLKSLTLKDLTFSDLSGISNATNIDYVYLNNCRISDYTDLSKVKKLTYLYLYNIDDSEFDKLCEGIKDAKYLNLKYFSISGNEKYRCSTEMSYEVNRTSNLYLTNLNSLSKVSSSCVQNVEYLSLQNNEIGDTLNDDNNMKYALENLKNFKALKLLRIECNNITSLKGIEHLTELMYIVASYNNLTSLNGIEDAQNLQNLCVSFNKLGDDEVYNEILNVTESDGSIRPADEYDKGKNPLKDALVALSGKTKLSYLNLIGNTNLKWVGYIKNLPTITSLYLGNDSEGCINMVDSEVAKIKEILTNCGRYKSYPSKYWLVFLDKNAEELDVDLGGNTITISQFNSLSEYPNIKALCLKDLKIIVSSTDNRQIPSLDADLKDYDINIIVNNVLKKIKKLTYLDLRSSSETSLSEFNDISFLKGEDLSSSEDDIILTELSCLGTKVSTHIQNDTGNWVEYNKGLKILDEISDNSLDKRFGGNLRVLNFAEEHVNLGLFEKTVSSVIACADQPYFYTGGLRGLYVGTNRDVIKSIENVKGISYFNAYGWSTSGEEKLTLDFSSENFSSLKRIYLRDNVNFIFGPNIEFVCISSLSADADLSKAIGLQILEFSGCQYEQAKKALVSLPDTAIVSKLENYGDYFGDYSDLNIFREVHNLRIATGKSDIKVKQLIVQNGLPDITSLNGIEFLSGLNKVEIKNTSPDLKDISALANLASSLKQLTLIGAVVDDISCLGLCTELFYVDLHDNSISDASCISTLANLTYLNLEDNCLFPFVNVIREGENIRINMLEVICDRMKKNAVNKKVTLKLKGNSSIIDWNIYLNNSNYWTSDSSYGG